MTTPVPPHIEWTRTLACGCVETLHDFGRRYPSHRQLEPCPQHVKPLAGPVLVALARAMTCIS